MRTSTLELGRVIVWEKKMIIDFRLTEIEKRKQKYTFQWSTTRQYLELYSYHFIAYLGVWNNIHTSVDRLPISELRQRPFLEL